MSKTEREKGKRGEREVAEMLRRYGFEAYRDGRLDADINHSVDGVHFEVKRREKLALPEWTRQAEDEADEKQPVVVYRSNGQRWRASVNFDFLCHLLAIREAYRSEGY